MNEYVLIEKQELAQIADKVRSLSGSTETMNVLEIDNKLDSANSTIDNAVTAAISALTEKGITVPNDTKVDGLAALIEAIESGGDVLYTTITLATTGSTTISYDGRYDMAFAFIAGDDPTVPVAASTYGAIYAVAARYGSAGEYICTVLASNNTATSLSGYRARSMPLGASSNSDKIIGIAQLDNYDTFTKVSYYGTETLRGFRVGCTYGVLLFKRSDLS